MWTSAYMHTHRRAFIHAHKHIYSQAIEWIWHISIWQESSTMCHCIQIIISGLTYVHAYVWCVRMCMQLAVAITALAHKYNHSTYERTNERNDVKRNEEEKTSHDFLRSVLIIYSSGKHNRVNWQLKNAHAKQEQQRQQTKPAMRW